MEQLTKTEDRKTVEARAQVLDNGQGMINANPDTAAQLIPKMRAVMKDMQHYPDQQTFVAPTPDKPSQN